MLAEITVPGIFIWRFTAKRERSQANTFFLSLSFPLQSLRPIRVWNTETSEYRMKSLGKEPLHLREKRGGLRRRNCLETKTVWSQIAIYYNKPLGSGKEKRSTRTIHWNASNLCLLLARH